MSLSYRKLPIRTHLLNSNLCKHVVYENESYVKKNSDGMLIQESGGSVVGFI